MVLTSRPGVTASARLGRLRELLAHEGKISSRQAAQSLGCSLETIRQDLLTLEQRGELRRAHGGALPVGNSSLETPLDQRTSNVKEKRRIAAAAFLELKEHSTVFLESGSTTHQVALLVPHHFPLTVFTNSLPIAATLLPLSSVTTHLIGGTLRPLTQATAGHWALRELADLRVDTAVLGTNAISLSGELSTPDSDEAAIKAAALKVATRSILLADHSKFTQRAPFHYGTLGKIDLLLSDTIGADVARSITDYRPRELRFL